MLKYTRKDKRLKIPVGINPSYNVDASLMFNTSDADAKPEDLVLGKTAYSIEGYITGTLDVETEKTNSYNEGYAQGEQDGYISGEADGYADGYAEGKDDGIEEILTEQSDANITASSVLEGYIGYGANNQRIVGTNVGGFNFGEIGYSPELSNQINRDLKAPLDYTISLMPIDPSTSLVRKFRGDTSLYYAPYIDTSITTNMSEMFYGCTNLSVIPKYDYTNVVNVQSMFSHSGIKEIDFSFSNNIQWFNSLATYSPSVEKIVINAENVQYKPNGTPMGYEGLSLSNIAYDCSALKYLKIFNIPKFAARNGIWRNCKALEYIELSGDTSEFQPLTSNNDFTFNGYEKLHTVIFNIDTHFLRTCYSMFEFCYGIIDAPYFNTSNVTSFERMFYNCKHLNSVPLYDTTNVTTMQNTFGSCSITELPAFNTANVTNIDGFIRDSSIITIPTLDFSKVNNTGNLGMWNGFSGSKYIENISGLTNFGQGFTGSTANGLTLTSSTKLTRESCLNLFNSLYDMNTNTSYTGVPTIQLSSTTKALLSAEDLAIATNKGWTIS